MAKELLLLLLMYGTIITSEPAYDQPAGSPSVTAEEIIPEHFDIGTISIENEND